MSTPVRRWGYVLVGLLVAAALSFSMPASVSTQVPEWPIIAPDGGAIRTRPYVGSTFLLQAYNTTTGLPTTMATFTAGTTPTLDLVTGTTIGSAYVYRVSGTDVALADGGTGASLTDPGGDRIAFWDESAGTGGAVTWLTMGNSVAITATTLDTIQDIRTSAAPTFAGASLTGDTTVSKTLTSATPATERLLYSTITASPTGNTFAIGTGGSLAGVRGEFNVPTGKTMTDGFGYGAQGKSVFTGVLAEVSAARVTGVLGQTDTTGATLTAGQVSAVWADLQGDATNTQTFPLRVTNSMSVDARALGFFYGTATYLFEVSDAASAKFVETTAGTGAGECAQTGGLVASKALKITANGTEYWIPLCTAK